jgi:hypothetical protein
METMNSFTALADYIPTAVADELDDRAEVIRELKMPFGKYKGTAIFEVPLSYLDRTISGMPPTWFANSIREFVAKWMRCAINEQVVDQAQVPNLSAWQIWLEVQAARRADSETLPTDS